MAFTVEYNRWNRRVRLHHIHISAYTTHIASYLTYQTVAGLSHAIFWTAFNHGDFINFLSYPMKFAHLVKLTRGWYWFTQWLGVTQATNPYSQHWLVSLLTLYGVARKNLGMYLIGNMDCHQSSGKPNRNLLQKRRHLVSWKIKPVTSDFIAKDPEGLDSDRWIRWRGGVRIPQGL